MAAGLGVVRSFPPDFLLFLASQSPRRQHLLEVLGVPFVVVTTSGEEAASGPAAEVTRRNALSKVCHADIPVSRPALSFVLGVDTVVVVDDRILGKPVDRSQARRMLEELAGREHSVVSGLALRRFDPDGVREETATATTRVVFRPLMSADVEAYLDSGEWSDKAGAYAIQGFGGLLVEAVEGEYANVVGLPIGRMAELFRRLGFDLLRRAWLTV